MKTLHFWVCTLCFIPLLSLAADTTLTLQLSKTIPGRFDNFYVDNLNNIYVVSSATNGIRKFNSNGDSVGVYNNVLRYGKIYSVDVTNPLKELVYYKDFSTILVLDRFLATRATIDLRRLGITQVKAVAQSYDGNIWLYDEGEGKIKKVDENNDVLLESSDLRLVFDEALSPAKMIDNNGTLYLYDNRLGWLLFDYYTTFKKRLPFGEWNDVGVNDNQLFGRIDSQFVYALQNDFNDHRLTPNISLADAIKTDWQQSKIYVLRSDGLSVYNIKQ